MKPFFHLAVLFVITFFASGCASIHSDSKLQHVVLCWLKEPGNADHRAQIEEVSRSFRKIPGVISVETGQVVASERGIVDDSFDVGIIIEVRDEAALADYLSHPIHEEAKNDVLVPLVSKILVYDFKS